MTDDKSSPSTMSTVEDRASLLYDSEPDFQSEHLENPPVPTHESGKTTVEVTEPIRRLHKLATLMDSQFKIPIIGRIGLDPIIGLIPVVGDLITYGVSAYIIVQAGRLGVPTSKITRMSFNTLIDVLSGYVPVLGDLVDATYKSNARNVNIILDHFNAKIDENNGDFSQLPVESSFLSTKGKIILWAVAITLLLLLLALIAIPILLLYLIFSK